MTTKEKLTEMMAYKLRTQGYYATGIREILSETDVPKGSLYHHFPLGKVDLACAALTRSDDKMIEKFRASMKGKGAMEALASIVEVTKNELLASDFQEGCPIATVALEVSHSEIELSKLTATIYERWENGLTDFLTRRKVPDPRLLAASFLMQLEGAIILSKVHRNLYYFDLLIQNIHNLAKHE